MWNFLTFLMSTMFFHNFNHTSFFCKIILYLCRKDPCPGPHALGAPAVTLLWPPFSSRQAVVGPKLWARGCTSPLDHTCSAQGSRVPCPKNPGLLPGPRRASSHVHPPEGSPHHQPDHSWAWGSPRRCLQRGWVNPECLHVAHSAPCNTGLELGVGKEGKRLPGKSTRGRDQIIPCHHIPAWNS